MLRASSSLLRSEVGPPCPVSRHVWVGHLSPWSSDCLGRTRPQGTRRYLFRTKTCRHLLGLSSQGRQRAARSYTHGTDPLLLVVPPVGLEPTRLAADALEASVSTVSPRGQVVERDGFEPSKGPAHLIYSQAPLAARKPLRVFQRWSRRQESNLRPPSVGLPCTVALSPYTTTFSSVQSLVRRTQRVAVRTQQLQVRQYVVSRVAINMLQLNRATP